MYMKFQRPSMHCSEVTGGIKKSMTYQRTSTQAKSNMPNQLVQGWRHNKILFNYPKRLHVKFGFNRPSCFWEDVWNCWIPSHLCPGQSMTLTFGAHKSSCTYLADYYIKFCPTEFNDLWETYSLSRFHGLVSFFIINLYDCCSVSACT